jgi:hypothetical protein
MNITKKMLKQPGNSNGGIALYAINTSSGHPLLFVEKIVAASSYEAALCSALHATNPAPQHLVAVLGIAPGPDATTQVSVFMEHIAEAGSFKLQQLSAEHAQHQASQLSDQLCRALQSLNSVVSRCTMPLRSFDNILGRYLHRHRLQQPQGDTPLFRQLSHVQQAYQAIDPSQHRVIAHNDLHFNNMQVNKDFSVKLFDLGLVAYNTVGADLHHFYSAKHKSPAHAALYKELVQVYARSFNAPTPVVELASSYYAIFRAALRLKCGEHGFTRTSPALDALIADALTMAE